MRTRNNDADHVNNLYVKQNTLNARIALHQQHSTNPYGWNNWVFDQIELKPDMRILELGCGTAALWSEHIDRVPNHIEILLTDFSETMLGDARSAIGNDPRFSFRQMDIQQIETNDDTFDAVIANHMLYHVPDIDKGLAEVARVLKPTGQLYTSTFGRDTLKELFDLYTPFVDRIPFTLVTEAPFILENGETLLQKHFADVERRDYIDSLHVTDPEALLRYIHSVQPIPPELADEFDAHIRAAFAPSGALHITKQQGIFISK